MTSRVLIDRLSVQLICRLRYIKMKIICLIVAIALVTACKAATPNLRFAWKEISYTWDSPQDRENAIQNGIYEPTHNLILGLARWKDKLFITVPRWRNGVASSLNYINVNGAMDQPLIPYPSWKDNLIADSAKELPTNSSIVSVFRVYVDACDRLWVMDTGLADRFGARNQVAGPSLLIFDLNTDQLIHRYFLKTTDIVPKSFFANVVVDVDSNTCDDAFAYVSDIKGYSLVVYSLKQDDSWRITHDYFNYDPLASTYQIGGLEFQWTDGVFGLALSDPREDGFRTVYLHAMSGTKEFSVSTEILRNYTNIDQHKAVDEFKLLGDRGEKAQSSSSFYDPRTKVVFYTQINRDGVACWNTNKPFTVQNYPLLFTDPELLQCTVDLKVDDQGNLWVLSDRLQKLFYQSMDSSEVNYRIFSIPTSEAIAGTACQ